MATNIPPSVLADNLRRLLGVYGLSISEGAGVLALSRQSVSEHLRGNRQPSWATVHRIAKTFEIDADDLMTRPFEEWAGTYFADPARFRRVKDVVVLDHDPANPVKAPKKGRG